MANSQAHHSNLWVLGFRAIWVVWGSIRGAQGLRQGKQWPLLAAQGHGFFQRQARRLSAGGVSGCACTSMGEGPKLSEQINLDQQTGTRGFGSIGPPW